MSEGAEKYILSFDHGTSGLKAALFDTAGNLMDHDFEPTPVFYLPGGGAEQDPEHWWKALLTAAGRVTGRNPAKARNIKAIAVSSTFSSTVAVDERGKHLMNSMIWLDYRAAPLMKKMMGGFPEMEGYNIFNVLRWVSKTGGGPQLSGKDDIAHILYIKHHFPELYKKTFKFIGSKDYLNLRLTGKIRATFDSVHLFWLTDIRKLDNIHYDDELIKKTGIDRSKLPDLCYSTDILGEILPETAEAIHVPKGTVVIAGSPDHQSAQIGSGAVRDFEGHLYIGTSSWIECIIPFKKTDVLHSIASMPTAIRNKYQCINEQDLAGGCLPYLINNMLFYPNVIGHGNPPGDIYQRLDAIVEQVPAGSNKLIFTPWLNGERTPVDSKTLRACLYNMSITTNQNDIIRAFFEGVAYNTKWSLKYVEKFTGKPLSTLSMIGGGAKSDVWCQIFADVLNRDIRRVKDPIAANARGAAYIAAVGMGYISFEDIPSLIHYDRTFHPDPAYREVYDGLFAIFLDIFRKNLPLFRRLNPLI